MPNRQNQNIKAYSQEPSVDTREALDESELIELIHQVELRQEIASNEAGEGEESAELLSLLSGLSAEQKNQAEQVFAAQRLLAQLSKVNPPEDLPLNTARRARRRRRQSLIKPNKTWLDQLLSLAVLVLVFAIISLIFHHLRDERNRQRVEQLKVSPSP